MPFRRSLARCELQEGCALYRAGLLSGHYYLLRCKATSLNTVPSARVNTTFMSGQMLYPLAAAKSHFQPASPPNASPAAPPTCRARQDAAENSTSAEAHAVRRRSATEARRQAADELTRLLAMNAIIASTTSMPDEPAEARV